MAERGSEAYWAHVLWQRHNLPMEVFLGWPWQKRLAYIASEQYENAHPVRRDSLHFKVKGGG